MKAIDLKCSNCGAALEPSPDGGTVVCKYCGHRLLIDRPKPPPQPKPVVIVKAPDAPPPTSGGRGRGFLFTVALLGVITAATAPAWRPLLKGAGGLSMPTLVNERLLWHHVGGPPVVAAIGGQEVAIGRVRAGDDDQLKIAAVDPAGARIRWRSGPLGSYSDGYRATWFVVAGERVVASDFHSRVHVYDLASGREERAVTLTDRVESLCALPDGQVWASQVDRRAVTIQLATGAVEEAKRPASCPSEKPMMMWMERHHHGGAHGAPHVAGFAARDVLTDGDDAVALGIKSPGTPVPMAVGFDPAGGKVRWQAVVPAVDAATARSDEEAALFRGRFVAAYGAGSKGYHLTAFDATSGARQWDVALRKLFAVDSLNGVTASPRYVYVGRTSSLDVFDAANGRLLGAVGSETYED